MATLSEAEIAERMTKVAAWRRAGGAIRGEFSFPDFVASMGFVNKVALLAEKADHHPAMTVTYNRVVLELSTHSEGGLTTKDFELAEKIDAVA